MGASSFEISLHPCDERRLGTLLAVRNFGKEAVGREPAAQRLACAAGAVALFEKDEGKEG